MTDPHITITGFARPNLRFEVDPHRKRWRSRTHRSASRCASSTGSGVIYVATVKEAERLHAMLADDFAVGLYHGKCAAADRKEVQDRFMAGDLKAIIATNAFGLGIDKQDSDSSSTTISRDRSRPTIRKREGRGATVSRPSARFSTASRTSESSHTSSAASIPRCRRRPSVALALEKYPLKTPVLLDDIVEVTGIPSRKAQDRLRAAQAARSGARAPRGQVGAPRRTISPASTSAPISRTTRSGGRWIRRS